MRNARLPLKYRVYTFLDLAEPQDFASKCFDIFLLGLIFLNLVAVALETVDSLFEQYYFWFRAFEIFSVAVFTIEYLLRVWSCTVKEAYRHPIWGRLRFMVTPLSIIDLLAIIPFYLPLLSPQLRVGRALRLFRLFRVLKLNRYTDSLKILVRVLRLKQEELILSLFVLSILLAIASSLIYFAEHNAQPEAFSSIPEAMWWGTITLTTVGYGDVYPITLIGRMLGAILAILGIGLFALPAGILASGFSEELQARKAKRKQENASVCPHCGKAIQKD
ncbi:Ion transport protein [Halothece sp. PCC 7418]|uniref:ion transporter n=1 Tax=Halothece sp. (strain PCC 7418) TaxID=65093 RepID=UPI0002A06BB4|nr:ion transporter [Halothece sp. PCC 7418]AFZ43102.1 Ion transport protein [Halothece sp. PCC 7418]